MSSERVQMGSLIDAQHAHVSIRNVDLIEGAWALCNSPISGKRLIEKLEEQGSVDAVMAYQHDGLAAVPREKRSQHASYPGRDFIQRLPAGYGHEMRSTQPPGKSLRRDGLDVLE